MVAQHHESHDWNMGFLSSQNYPGSLRHMALGNRDNSVTRENPFHTSPELFVLGAVDEWVYARTYENHDNGKVVECTVEVRLVRAVFDLRRANVAKQKLNCVILGKKSIRKSYLIMKKDSL